MADPCECGDCKRCQKREYDRRRREANPGANAARCKAYYEANRERANQHARNGYLLTQEERIAQVNAYQMARRQADPGAYSAMLSTRSKRWRERNPEKALAHSRFHHAVARGEIVKQPCEVCGADAEAHHDDYTKPLDVRWVCRKHHKALHSAAA